MALNGTVFSPEVQKRLKTYPAIADKSIKDDSPVFYGQIPYKTRLNKPQALPIPGSKQEGYSEIYKSVIDPSRLISTTHPKIKTMVDAFEASTKANAKADAFGERGFDYVNKKWTNFTYISYEIVAKRRSDLGKGIADLVQDITGVDARQQRYCVGIYGPNCTNWLLTDLGCQTQSLPTVCLYDTLGPDSTEYIINLSEMPVIVASASHIPFLLSIKSRLPNLKAVIAMHDLKDPNIYEKPGQSNEETLTAWAKTAGVQLYTFSEIEGRGAKSPRGERLPEPQDVLTINFTSGTTGNPKGVILTHANILACVATFKYNKSFDLSGTNGFLSFLPLAHIYERVSCLSMICNAVRIGFFHGEIPALLEDILEMHPSMLAGVPRVWNRIAGALRTQTIDAPGIAGMLSRRAFAAKVQRIRESGDFTHPIWDRLWSSKIRKKLGFDKTIVFATGSAPMATDNIELLKAALSVEFVQGYGLTETVGGISGTVYGDNHHGSVGPPSVSTEIKLRDLPAMNYTSADKPYPRGEVMIRGPQVFQGYYKNEDATREAIDEDGFFHSGDVGMIDDQGRLFIIDRAKNFFKLAQGEYVGPERIESLYQSTSTLLAQIFIEGNSLETYLVAVVGVMPDTYVAFLASKFKLNIAATDLDAIAATFTRKDIRDAFVNEVNKQAKSAQLKGYEKIRNVHLALEPFSVENGTMTPTLKVKRLDAGKLYKAQIDAMYKEGPVPEFEKASL